MNKKVKNYIILIVIIVVTVIAVFYARNYYLETKKYYGDNSVMLEAVNEIHENELNNYILENPKFVLYTSSLENEKTKSFENNFKNFIVNEELNSDFIYLSLDEVNKGELQNLLEKTAKKSIKEQIKVKNNVSMYVIENGKIVEVINDAENYQIDNLKNIIKQYGVLTDD